MFLSVIFSCMSNIFEADDNSTPLNEEEQQGLIPSWITTRSELNNAEASGIFEAEKWLLTGKQKDLLSEKFVKLLHKKMFESIWKWAGKFRTKHKSQYKKTQVIINLKYNL